MSSRKRSAWTWIVFAVIGAPVLYVLSFGPACWWCQEDLVMGHPWLYFPIGRVARLSGSRSIIFRVLSWYATLGTYDVLLPADPDSSPYGEGYGLHGDWVYFKRKR